MKRLLSFCLALALALALPAHADWREAFRKIFQGAQQPAAQAALSNSDILAGLKEALAQGTTRAINTLGRSDGFWGNAGLRIPLPDHVARVESTLRKFGQGALVEQFHLTLNRAAEQAVPQAADIFGNALRQMTIEDARGILEGPQDAATQFFRRTTGSAIHARLLPIVQSATQKVGVTQQYKRLTGAYAPLMQMAGMPATDLDDFVAHKALDSLFLAIAAEEARIRANPAARTTEILKKVFGGRL